MLQEAGQQHLVEVGVLDADDLLVGTPQPAPVQDRVTRRDVEGTGDARPRLLDAGEEGLRLREHPAPTDLLGVGRQAPRGLGRLGDERPAPGDPLQESLGDQGVERLAHRHPGHAEAGDQLALGRRRRPGGLALDEPAHVLTHLHVLQRPLTRDDEVHRLHATQAKERR